jgi:hypothetical protein
MRFIQRSQSGHELPGFSSALSIPEAYGRGRIIS